MTDNRIEKIRAEIERRRVMNFEKKQGSRALEDMDMINYIDSMQEEPVSKDTPFEPIGIPADAVELANIPNKKEPTIPDIVDEHYWEMLGEEPVSEDLEKEIEIYMGTNLEWDSDALRDPIESWGIKIARHFAAWQKEQDKQWLAENHKHIFAKGRESAEVWISADDDVNNAAEKTTRRFCKICLLSGDYLSLAEAQPQVNKESKLIAIKSFVCGAQWDRNKLMKEAVDGVITFDYYKNDKAYGCVAHDSFCLEDSGLRDCDKVKMIVLKEK